MKILVAIDQFEMGGGARVTSLMLKGLIERGIDIVLAVDNIAYSVFYEIPEDVMVYSLHSTIKGNGKIKVIKRLVDLSKQLHKIIKSEKPDVLIGIMPLSYLNLLIANIRHRLPLIAVDHTSFNRKTLPLTSLIRNKLYKYSDVLSILTQRDANYLGEKYPQKEVIYNPLTFPILNQEMEREKTILCAGRFDFWKVKGFDMLARIWGQIAINYPDWKLQIAGSGNESDTKLVKSLFEEECPAGSYEFLGQVSDMKTLYSRTAIYTLTSRVEGFPMVLMEAMSQGCACVAFSIEGAIEEMMSNEISGSIVEDGNILEFQNRLKELLDDDNKRRKYSINARKEVNRFTLDVFIDRWIEILNALNK